MKYGLSESAIEKINRVLAAYPEVEKAILYGSRAMGTDQPGSDIDLTLQGKNLSGDVLARIASALDDLLLPQTIDLSRYEIIDNLSLLDHIRRVGVTFFDRSQMAQRLVDSS